MAWPRVALCSALVLVPLVIGLAWGAHFDDSVYVTFRYARNLANGRGLSYDGLGERQVPLGSLLYAWMLALPAGLGIPLPQVGLILGSLGWGVAAVAVYSTGRAMGRSLAAVTSALLVVCSPMVASTLGTGISWTTALAWIAIASSMRKRWGLQTVALALMLFGHADLSTLTLAALLAAVQWAGRRRFPFMLCLVLVAVALGWVLATTRQVVAPVLVPDLDLGEWGRGVRRLLGESELYWLFLPLLLCGGVELVGTPGKRLGHGLLWGAWMAASILSGSLAAMAMMAATGSFLTGLGVNRVAEWIATRRLSRLDRCTLMLSVTLVAGAPLGIAQVSSLYQRYRFRPVMHRSLEQQAGEWLRVHAEPGATVLGSERIGYLADRSVFAWNGEEGDPEELELLLESLDENLPDYCVSFNGLAWDRLMRTGWFQEAYVPLRQFESPYDAASPVIIWRQRFREFGLVEWQALPLNVRLPGRVYWVGYEVQPERIEPGDVVRVTLFSQLTQAQPASPSDRSFQIVVRMVSPSDGASWAQQSVAASRSVVMDSQRTGQVIAEQFVLTPPADVPVGAYRLDASVVAHRSGMFLPVYLNDDTVPYESVSLGYVVVPWRGQLDGVERVDANFGNQITLLGFEALDSASPGTGFDVGLYWEARRTPEDDYFVFVHLLDADGRLVAQHDGPPMEGRYPATAWLPGDVVPDVHRITLGPDTPAGTYQLQVGMYGWPSLERLLIWDEHGVEQINGVIILQSVQVQ